MKARFEILEGLNPVLFQTFDCVERYEPDERTDAKLCYIAVREAQNVVEELVLFVPNLYVVLAHLLHRSADIRVVLEELRRQTFVCAVLFRKLKRDAHEVEAEHTHPAGRVRLL